MSQPARHLRRSDATPGPDGGTRHLRVVSDPERTPAQRRYRARLTLVAGIGLAVAVMFGLVYLHVVLAQRQIELDRLTTVAANRQTAYQTNRLRVAQLESPQQVISVAEGRLGMRQPASVTDLTPPATAPSAAVPVPSGMVTPMGTAVAGDADWPRIKAELAGRP